MQCGIFTGDWLAEWLLHQLGAKLQVDQEKLLLEHEKAKAPLIKQRNAFFSKIPNFWQMAFEKHPVLGELIEGEDADLMSYLKTIYVENDAEMFDNFTIEMTFEDNEYLASNVLKKTFKVEDDTHKVINYPIKWKEGKVSGSLVF